jgi:CRISPR-associated protein Cas1
MEKITVYLGSGVSLRAQYDQLIVIDKELGLQKQMAFEEIGVVVMESGQLNMTGVVLQKLMEFGAVMMVCDDKHLPSGMLLPHTGNTMMQKRVQAQMNASKALNKQLWAQTVAAKVYNQATVLSLRGGKAQDLFRIAKEVKAGDSTFIEGYAAKIYWQRLLEDPNFYRAQEGPWPNPIFNYAYSVLRAQTARALVAAGLTPALGIYHNNQYNHYPLADDIMEPFRPIVDLLVMDWLDSYPELHEIVKETKRHILTLPQLNVLQKYGQQKQHPSLETAVERVATTLAQCYMGEKKQLPYPVALPLAYAGGEGFDREV